MSLTDNSEEIHTPIGEVSRMDTNMYSIKVSKSMKLSYINHAVDLAFELTVWKAQGGTFPYVLGSLESSVGSLNWTYEMLYVMLSRVREASKYRCLQLSKNYDKSKFLQLRQRIRTV